MTREADCLLKDVKDLNYTYQPLETYLREEGHHKSNYLIHLLSIMEAKINIRQQTNQ